VLKLDECGVVVVRPDQLKNAGLGLKAIVDIPSKTPVTMLSEEIHFREKKSDNEELPLDAIVLPDGGYALTTYGLAPQERTLGSFVNDVRSFRGHNKIMPLNRKNAKKQLNTNAEILSCGPDHKVSVVVSTMKIHKNDYVYAYYGDAYTDKKRKRNDTCTKEKKPRNQKK
jgi:hypothetical protein